VTDPTAPELSYSRDTRRAYCVAVIYDGDAIEIEVLAHSAIEAMEEAEKATAELLPGWTELVLICEPDYHQPQTRNHQ
jgi:hypothetical protein